MNKRYQGFDPSPKSSPVLCDMTKWPFEVSGVGLFVGTLDECKVFVHILDSLKRRVFWTFWISAFLSQVDQLNVQLTWLKQNWLADTGLTRISHKVSAHMICRIVPLSSIHPPMPSLWVDVQIRQYICQMGTSPNCAMVIVKLCAYSSLIIPFQICHLSPYKLNPLRIFFLILQIWCLVFIVVFMLSYFRIQQIQAINWFHFQGFDKHELRLEDLMPGANWQYAWEKLRFLSSRPEKSSNMSPTIPHLSFSSFELDSFPKFKLRSNQKLIQ